jgi:predicted DNA-binding transcriptional regulator YafY
MPKNKEALIRYRVINKCLLDRKYVTKEELKKACERALDIYPIGERTIDADINAMRNDERLGYLAPIKIDRSRRAYYYEDPAYSIDNIPLNEEELESIVFASKLLEQFKGVEIFERFAGSVQKLVNAVNAYRNNDEDTYRNFIEFEKVDEAKGNEYLEPLINALKNREVLKIEYKTFTARKNTVNIIHPYLLKEYRNRWYLVGFNEKYSGIRTYSLDRFVNLEVDTSIDFIDKGFDAKKYYENVIGISVLNKKPVEILIAFTENQAQYVITQPLHSSQELVTTSHNKYIFKYFLVPNFEFIAQILGWGEEVEIIKPKILRKEMQILLRRMVQKYNE